MTSTLHRRAPPIPTGHYRASSPAGDALGMDALENPLSQFVLIGHIGCGWTAASPPHIWGWARALHRLMVQPSHHHLRWAGWVGALQGRKGILVLNRICVLFYGGRGLGDASGSFISLYEVASTGLRGLSLEFKLKPGTNRRKDPWGGWGGGREVSKMIPCASASPCPEPHCSPPALPPMPV